MARKKRIRSKLGIYHVYSRSIPEFNLFKNRADKVKFMEIIEKYKEVFGFSLYSYCLMNNHFHILIKTNGSDISKIYHRINLCYAIYFNKKYKRRGSVFTERFKSKVITNIQYLKTASLYIHRNPKAFCTTRNGFYKYEFSSLGIILKTRDDKFNIVNDRLILDAFGEDLKSAISNYKNVFEKYFMWLNKFKYKKKSQGDLSEEKIKEDGEKTSPLRFNRIIKNIRKAKIHKNREYRLTKKMNK